MNKLFTKIVGAALGLTVAIGVGVAVASNSKEATSVFAAYDAGHTVNGVEYDEAYFTGFESASTATAYQNNNVSSTTSQTDGVPWAIYCGNFTTDSAMAGSKAAQNRLYKDGYCGYMMTTADVLNVKAFKFKYKVSNTNVHFKVQYSTDSGSTWTDKATLDSTSTSETLLEYTLDSVAAKFRFKVLITEGHPSSSNRKLTIDDVYFGKEKASTTTVSFNQNEGTGGQTSSVTATNGSAMPAISAVPTRTGYTFAGYYDAQSGGTKYYNADKTSAKNWDKDDATYTLYAHWDANQYDINYYDQGGSAFSGSHESGYPTQHTYGTATTLKSATKGGYSFDGWFTTSACTGSAVSSLGATSYTAAINLYAKWTAIGTTYSITTTVSGGTYSGDTSITDNGGIASVTIAATGDHKLPSSLSSSDVTGADFTYNSSTGVISLSNATANVVINVTCPDLTSYSITVNETNGSHTGASTILESRTATLTFTPTSGWGQPADVTVSGATKSWVRNTGVLTLSNPTGNVTVTYSAAANELTSITLSATSGSYTLGDAFVKPTVTAHYTVAVDADVTSSATYTGYNPYATGSQTVTLSYGGKTATYTATVAAKSLAHTYNKISAVNEIVEGDYIIAYSTYGFSGVDANNGYTTMSISSDSITGSAAVDKLAVHIVPVTDGYTLQLSSTHDTQASKYVSFTSGSNSMAFADSAKTMSISLASSSTHYTYSSGGKFAIGDSSTALSFNANSGNMRFRFYKTSTITDSTNGKNYYAVDLYKKVSSGSASLIRIVCDENIDAATGYKGGDKFVGDKISTSDFVVKKQLDTGTGLTAITGFTINGGTEVTLNSTSNNITISYTEGGVTKTTSVVVSATEREAELTSVTLQVGENAKLDGYVAWSGASWDLTDITVFYDWTGDEYDETVDLQDLVDAGDASISPATPTVGATSFTVSYEYMDVELDDATVTLEEAVAADYVKSVSWGGKSLDHFKAFSGEQLTSTTVDNWTVKATYAGAGESAKLSFGTGSNQFTIKVGSKSVTSLPYTWTSEDDGEYIAIVVGGVAKEDHTYAVANICGSINAIDHDETTSGEQTLGDFYDGMTIDTEGTSGGGAACEAHNGSFVFRSDDGYAQAAQIRSYKNSSFTISSSYTIKTINFTFSGSYNGGLETSYSNINSTSKSFSDLSSQARITNIEIVYEGTVTTTVHYANQADHFDAQKAVVKYAKAFNTAMNASNVCNGTFENLETGWANASAAYTTFLSDISSLDVSEQTWAKSMLAYANNGWSTDAEAACVDKAMATYDHVVRTYKLTAFMSSVRSVSAGAKIRPLSIFNNGNTNTVAIIVIISVISVTAIGGYFMLKKRKEDSND